MTDYNQEYFYLRGGGKVTPNGAEYPSLKYSNKYEPHSSMELLSEEVLDETKRILSIWFIEPMPPIEFADFHNLEATNLVVSEQIKNVLESFNLKDVQLIPAVILDKKEKQHDGFYIIKVNNLLKVMDKENSSWEEYEKKLGKGSIGELVLDNEVMDKIPLEERFVFAAWEDNGKVLFHHFVIEKMLELNPKGLNITGLIDWWDSNISVLDEYGERLKKICEDNIAKYPKTLDGEIDYSKIFDDD
jgi:hypothetical protein